MPGGTRRTELIRVGDVRSCGALLTIGATAARLRPAGNHDDEIRPEAGELAHHEETRTFAETGEHDDRGDPDRDPDERESGALTMPTEAPPPNRSRSSEAHRFRVEVSG